MARAIEAEEGEEKLAIRNVDFRRRHFNYAFYLRFICFPYLIGFWCFNCVLIIVGLGLGLTCCPNYLMAFMPPLFSVLVLRSNKIFRKRRLLFSPPISWYSFANQQGFDAFIPGILLNQQV